MSNGLEDHGFVPSSIDPCVFFGQGCIVLTYVDDCIIVGDSMQGINSPIQLLYRGDEHFVLQDKGSVNKYLGVNIKQIDVNIFELAQPFLIERIIAFLGIKKGKTDEKLLIVRLVVLVPISELTHCKPQQLPPLRPMMPQLLIPLIQFF